MKEQVEFESQSEYNTRRRVSRTHREETSPFEDELVQFEMEIIAGDE